MMGNLGLGLSEKGLLEETVAISAERGSFVTDAILIACRRSGGKVFRFKDGEKKAFLLKGDGRKIRMIVGFAESKARALRRDFKQAGYRPKRESKTNLLLNSILEHVACN